MIGFVTESGKEQVAYYTSYNEKRKTGRKEFLESCSGAVILLNPDERSGEKDYQTKIKNELINKSIMPLAIFAGLLFIISLFYNNFAPGGSIYSKVILPLVFTKIAGIVLSVLLILHEFEVHISITDKLCHLNKATNCNTVLHDKASKVFGWFGWADVGFIYFTGSFLFLLQSPAGEGLSLMAILAALSVPYPLFSIYYQGFVLKKWCPMCLGVQLILITEFILLLPQLSQLSFSFDSFARLVLSLLVIAIVYTLFILFRKEQMSGEAHYYKYLGFKKNPDILRMLLMNQPHYEIPVMDSSLIFGNRNASIRITAFLSMHCSHCARAFEKIKKILNSKDRVTINIILISKDMKITNALRHFKLINDHDKAINLLDQWFNADSFSRKKISEDLCIPEDLEESKEINNENYQIFKKSGVLGTPTFFINGYMLPYQYDIDDIRYIYEVFPVEKNKLV